MLSRRRCRSLDREVIGPGRSTRVPAWEEGQEEQAGDPGVAVRPSAGLP